MTIWRFFMPFALLLTSACTPQPEPMVVGGNSWLGYQPLYLAESVGAYAGQGIEMRELPTSLDTVRAFRRGDIKAAALTLEEALMLAESGMPLCIPLVMSYSNGADTLLVQQGIDTLTELKGKRIGVENTAVGAHMLARALELGELGLTDIIVIPVDLDGQYQAFIEGRVDALITFEPLRTLLLAQGAKEIFSSAEIPNEITDLLVVEQGYFEQHPQQVSVLLEGWFKGLALMLGEMDVPQQAWLQQRTGLNAEELEQGLKLIRFHPQEKNVSILSQRQHPFRLAARKVNEDMLQRRVIGQRMPIDGLFCDSSRLAVYRTGEGS